MPTTEYIAIQEYELKKVFKENSTIAIPHEAYFFQRWNHAQIIGVFPKLQENAGVNKVLSLQCVIVSRHSIKTVEIGVSPSYLSGILSKGADKSDESIIIYAIVDQLKNSHNENRIQEDTFLNILQETKNIISKIIFSHKLMPKNDRQ